MRTLLFSLFVLAAWGSLDPAARAADSSQPADEPLRESRSAAQGGAIDTAGLEAFLDRFLERKMEEMQVPGAALSVVQDGEILLARGYGLADLENGVRVDPATTRFHVASVSKLVTATALMQLAENGRVSLEDDVARHLDTLDFERRFPEPLTVFHLLTHTSGIEDTFLFSTVPEQFLPPGDIVSYSNTGMSTAGQVVAAISGLPFEDYVAQNVLEPLGMPSSSFVPLSEDSPEAPIGYVLRGGEFEAQRSAFSRVEPAGSLSSTAVDMAHFMIAHLQGGRFGEGAILAPETVQRMHRRQATNHPGLSGVTLGFWESNRNGVRILDQKGDGSGFHAALFLFPAKGLGLFFACNRQAYGLSAELAGELIDWLYPAEVAAAGQPTVSDTDVQRFAGSYRWLRCPRKGLGKILGAGMEAQVRAARDGAISVSFGGLPIQANTLTQVEPGVFRAPSGGEFSREIGFRTTSDGRASHLFAGPFAFERLPWYESTRFLSSAGLLFLVTFFVGATAWPLAGLFRRLRKRTLPARPRLARVARALSVFLGLVNFGFMVGLVALLLSMAARQSFSVSPPLTVLLLLPNLSTVLAVALAVCSVLLWRTGEGSRAGRLALSAYSVVALAFIPYLAYYNLLWFGL